MDWAGKDVEGVDENFGDAVLYGVAVFPNACAEFAFDVEEGALADVFFGKVGLLAPHDEAVPLGALGDFGTGGGDAGTLGSSERQVGDRLPVDISYRRVAAYVADQYYLVDRGHLVSSKCKVQSAKFKVQSFLSEEKALVGVAPVATAWMEC